MPPQQERVKDVDPIAQDLKKELEQLSERLNRRENRVVEEVFGYGLSYYLSADEDIPEEDGTLVEDDFLYPEWQLNVFSYIRMFEEDLHWTDVKNAFLRKGLEYIEKQS